MGSGIKSKIKYEHNNDLDLSWLKSKMNGFFNTVDKYQSISNFALVTKPVRGQILFALVNHSK